MSRIDSQVRGFAEGNEPFMTHGHQILKARSYVHARPEWTKHPRQVQKLLLRSFPKLKTDPTQRTRAAFWARVIQLYFQLGYTRGQVAVEMNAKPKKVWNTIDRIMLVSKGLRANGKGKLSGVRGRPKKVQKSGKA